MVIGPIPLFDPLMRPVKFVGGGGFVVATAARENYFVGSDGSVTKLSLPTTAYGPLQTAFATSYHNGIYLLSGNTRAEDADAYEVAVIYASNDGKAWRQAFLGPSPGGAGLQSFTAALVWNDAKDGKPAAFHASYVTQVGEGDETVATEYEISSNDGVTWSSPISLGIADVPETSGYRSPFPGKYCKHHDCVDQFGQNVPDGFMSVSVQPVNPGPVFYSGGFVGQPSSPSNKIKVVLDETTTTKSVPLDDVWCVAAGGAWLAGGSGGLAMSSDGGNSWQTIDIDGNGVCNISGRG